MNSLTTIDSELEIARRTIRQALCDLGVGLAMAVLPAVILGLFVYFQAFSAKALIIAILAPLAALKLIPKAQLHVFPNYGHQDVFQGRNSDSDVFPRLLEFLKEQAQQSEYRRGRGEKRGVADKRHDPCGAPA